MTLINSQLTDSVLRRLGKSLVCLCIFFRSNIKDSRFPDVLRKYFHPLWVCFVGTAFSRRGIVFKWGGNLPAPPVSTNCRLNWYWDIMKNTSIITETCYSSPNDEYIYDMAYIWTAAAISVWIQLNCSDGAPLNEANPWVQLAPSCLSLNWWRVASQ